MTTTSKAFLERNFETLPNVESPSGNQRRCPPCRLVHCWTQLTWLWNIVKDFQPPCRSLQTISPAPHICGHPWPQFDQVVNCYNLKYVSILVCFKEHRRLVQSTPSRLIGKAFQVKDCKYARSPNSNLDEIMKCPNFWIFYCSVTISSQSPLAGRSGQHLVTMIVVGQFDSPAFHQQAEDYATALEGGVAQYALN